MAATLPADTLASYQPRLIERNGRFYFQIAELGLLASGSTVGEAYDTLLERRNALLDEARAADLLDELPPPARAGAGADRVTVKSDFRDFLIKTAIVAAAMALVLLPVSWSVGNAVSSVAASLKSKQGFGRKLERELERASRPEKAMDPARQAELLGQIRIVVSRVKPFLDELSPLFTGSYQCPESSDAARSADPS